MNEEEEYVGDFYYPLRINRREIALAFSYNMHCVWDKILARKKPHKKSHPGSLRKRKKERWTPLIC